MLEKKGRFTNYGRDPSLGTEVREVHLGSLLRVSGSGKREGAAAALRRDVRSQARLRSRCCEGDEGLRGREREQDFGDGRCRSGLDPQAEDQGPQGQQEVGVAHRTSSISLGKLCFPDHTAPMEEAPFNVLMN